MRRRSSLLVLLLAIVVLGVNAQQNGGEIVSEGIRRFQRSEFSQALLEFRKLLVDSRYEDVRGDAYFWIAKSTMALGRLEDAEENLEFYLLNFPAHPSYPEANYQKARLLYLQQEYQAAIGAFQRFIESYPNSPYVANAFYWSGEALFELGHLERARTLFQAVVEDYPTSSRVEAARYRISVIELKRREEELLKLLRWSHEESLRALEEFQQREQTYQEALSEYQRRLASLAEDDFRAEIAVLRSQVEELTQDLAERNTSILELQRELAAALEAANAQREQAAGESSQPSSATDQSFARPEESVESALLSLKADALDLKEFYIEWLRRNGSARNE